MPEKQQQIDCRRPICKALEGTSKFPCDAANMWHCISDITYYDGSNFRGLFVEDVVTFETLEGHQVPATVSFVYVIQILSWYSSSSVNEQIIHIGLQVLQGFKISY